MANKDCKHSNECDSCIKDEIKVLEDKIAKLKAKLPQQTVTIIHGCNHGCSWGHCFYQSCQHHPYYYMNMQNNTASNVTYTTANTLGSQALNAPQNSTY